MTGLFFRQSLYLSSLLALANETAVKPGFVAWIDGYGRYSAATAGAFGVADGYHVIDGQDGVQWADDSKSIDGYHVKLVYSPTNYTAPTNNVIGEHLANIDAQLSSGPALTYLPLVSGNQQAGSTYTLIGAMPVLDYSLLSGVYRLNTLIQIPAGSTAQIRLYDQTNSAILYESGIVAGLQTDYNFGPIIFTAPIGSAVIEFWMSTPTITGGSATCLAAGVTITAT